jgi:hypothetical protein
MTDITQTPLGKLVASEDNVLRTAATNAGVQNSRRQLPCTDCCNRSWSASTARASSRLLMAGHVSIDTTQVYAIGSKRRLRQPIRLVLKCTRPLKSGNFGLLVPILPFIDRRTVTAEAAGSSRLI